jgi:hypothetical protein
VTASGSTCRSASRTTCLSAQRSRMSGYAARPEAPATPAHSRRIPTSGEPPVPHTGRAARRVLYARET